MKSLTTASQAGVYLLIVTSLSVFGCNETTTQSTISFESPNGTSQPDPTVSTHSAQTAGLPASGSPTSVASGNGSLAPEVAPSGEPGKPGAKTDPVTSIQDEHVLFQAPEDAVLWGKLNQDFMKRGLSSNKFEIVELKDPRYAVLQSYVHTLWQSYTALFPEETKLLNEPPVILYDSEVVNAFVAKDPASSNILHAVFVLSGLLDTIGGVEAKGPISGVMAHELAHSVFKHVLPRHQNKINKFFHLSNEKLGFKAVKNPALDKLMSGWLDGAAAAGDLTYKELGNLPSLGAGRPWLISFWANLRNDLLQTSMACDDFTSDLYRWAGFMKASFYKNSFSVDPSDIAGFAKASDTLIASQKICFGSQKRNFKEVISETFGVPQDMIDFDPTFAELGKVYETATDPTEGLRALVAFNRQMMIEAEAKEPIDNVGYFTFEEHADDMSVIVQAHAKINPTSLGEFFSAIEKVVSPDSEKECQLTIDKKETPPIGTYTDPHRAICYRIAHVNELQKVMNISSPAAIEAFAHSYVQTTIPADIVVTPFFKMPSLGVVPFAGPLGFRLEAPAKMHSR